MFRLCSGPLTPTAKRKRTNEAIFIIAAIFGAQGKVVNGPTLHPGLLAPTPRHSPRLQSWSSSATKIFSGMRLVVARSEVKSLETLYFCTQHPSTLRHPPSLSALQLNTLLLRGKKKNLSEGFCFSLRQQVKDPSCFNNGGRLGSILQWPQRLRVLFIYFF